VEFQGVTSLIAIGDCPPDQRFKIQVMFLFLSAAAFLRLPRLRYEQVTRFDETADRELES
jgi:hypothetical protein